MSKKRVFVFPCGSEIGLELNRALSYSTHFDVVGGGSVDDHGSYAFNHYIGDLPFIDDPALLPRLKEILKSLNIDFLIPAHDSAVLKFAEWHERGAINDIILVGSPLKTCQLARSKMLTYKALAEHVTVPVVYSSSFTVNNYPVFLKPDIGQGSRGTCIAFSPSEIDFHLQRDPSLLICEYLPGEEYTVDCFTDCRGELRFSGARTRQRISGGISVRSIAADGVRFQLLAKTINTALTFRGQWFFQVKEREDGELALLEVAPRASGSSGFYRLSGVNLPLLSLHDAIGREVTVRQNPYVLETDRALTSHHRIDWKFDHVYVDLDDTIILNGQVNYLLLSALYRFKGEGKELHLITRHTARNGKIVKETLEEHAISYKLFDSITEVADEQAKGSLIKERKAIFIDDSFSERTNVIEALNIPVFDINEAIDLFATATITTMA